MSKAYPSVFLLFSIVIVYFCEKFRHMKSFEQWEREEVQLTFGIQLVDTLPLLDIWLAADEPITDFEQTTLSFYLRRLKKKAEVWNEDEIKFFFVANIVSLVDFFKENVYSAFTQRIIAAKVKDVHQKEMTLRGRVEFFVAMGEQKPREPFFFMHEYKPQYKTTPSDPQGQLLISMVAAQELNEHPHPLYAVYVVGQSWRFMILDGKQYAVSDVYDATKETELRHIFSMLKFCKKHIETLVG